MANDNINNINQALQGYVNHSGGAVGSDSAWGDIGKQFGVASNHYYHGKKTPNGNVEITEAEFKEGVQRVLTANKSLNRRPDRFMDLLARNWMQVKNADAVFAISTLDPKGKVTLPDGKGFTPVSGGTGWAVQMAIDSQKPVFLFDQASGKWMTFSGPDPEGLGWTELESAPALTKNFAGIGTRDINAAGKQAINDAYQATIRALGQGIAPESADSRDANESAAAAQLEEQPVSPVRFYTGDIAPAEDVVFVFGSVCKA